VHAPGVLVKVEVDRRTPQALAGLVEEVGDEVAILSNP
jgi:hypothetical protein